MRKGIELLPQEAADWDPVVDLSLIATPIQHCACLSLDIIAVGPLRPLENGDFDQAPVLDRSGRPCGIVDTKIARKRHSRREKLDLSDLNQSALDRLTRLSEVLTCLRASRSALVREREAPVALL